MPKGGVGLGVARGIEVGVNNFLNSYLAVKQMKHEEKYRKMAPIMQVLQAQIADPNTPLDQKIKAMDSIPHILDPNYKGVQLSVQLGLDKLAEQEVDFGEQSITETKPGLVEDQNAIEANKKNLKSGTQGNIYSDELSTDSTLATSINAPVTKTLKKKLLKRRGELSANDINIQKQLMINRGEEENQFQRQYKLAQLNAELQSKTLAQQGWKNNDNWTYDQEAKSWSEQWFNPITKESYKNTLPPGVMPESVILKQIQSGGKGGGVSKAYSTLKQAIATSLGREVDDPDVELKTARMWENNFATGVANKVQNITGTEPIQPNQQFNNNMAVLQAQQNHDKIVSDASASLNSVESLATRKNQAWQNAADTKAVLDKVIADGGEVGDSEYNSAMAQYNQARDDANKLETEYQSALKSHNANIERVKLSEQNLQKAGINTNNQGQAAQFSSQMRAAIAAVRKANPNTKLSDAQIAERIKADPKYSHIK